MSDSSNALQRLREPFPEAQVGKLPRVWCKDCRDARPAACGKNGHKIDRCEICNQKGTTAHLHLDYVGHAEVTHRLLDADPEWTWEPMGFDSSGLPAIQKEGNEWSLWIRLTVCGVSKPGVGCVTVERFTTEPLKQLISDALRNAAMRFGVALDLWAKSELDHTTSESDGPQRLPSDSTGATPTGPGAPSTGEGASEEAVESEPSPVAPSDDEAAVPPAPSSSSDPSPAGEQASAPSAPGRSQSAGGGGVGKNAATASSDDPEEMLRLEEIRQLIGRFNKLELQAKSEAMALKRSLGVSNWFEAEDTAIAKLRAKVAELEGVSA